MIPAWLHGLSIAFLLLGAVCAALIALDEAQHLQHIWIMNVIWPVTALLGTVWIVWQYFTYGRLAEHKRAHAAIERGEEMPGKQLVLFPVAVANGALHCGSGCTLGDLRGVAGLPNACRRGRLRLAQPVRGQAVRGLGCRLPVRLRVQRRIPVFHRQRRCHHVSQHTVRPTVFKSAMTAVVTRRWPIGPLLFLSMASCTHVQLVNSTTHTASTVMEIQYQMVMDNLARMERSPAILPSQIRIKQGTVQVSDEWGLYRLEASGALSGTFGGPRAERTVSEQWGADAISDPLAVKQLQDVYRAAMELPPLAAPSFLDVEKARITGRGTANHGSGAASKDAAMRIDLRRDVPHGWFHVGTEGDVPGDARYVGHSGRIWIWVMPEDLAGLSRFTLLVLFITKLGPGENNGSEMGLMYTGGGR